MIAQNTRDCISSQTSPSAVCAACTRVLALPVPRVPPRQFAGRPLGAAVAGITGSA